MIDAALREKLDAAGDLYASIDGGGGVSFFDKSKPGKGTKGASAYRYLGHVTPPSRSASASLIFDTTGRVVTSTNTKPRHRDGIPPQLHEAYDAVYALLHARSAKEIEKIASEATIEETRAAADAKAGPLRYRRNKSGGRTARRDKRIREHAKKRSRGVCECGCGVEYPTKWMEGHHVRRDEECRPLGIEWDSRQNLMAIRPDCHVPTRFSESHRVAMFETMDLIAARDH